MFAADIALVQRVHATYGLKGPVVDAGGLENPCIADYQRTIDAMRTVDRADEAAVKAAQGARYLDISRPFSFLGEYDIENPESGGKRIEELPFRGYNTVLCFSVLEHTPSPWVEADLLCSALDTGGMLVLSVPFCFPEHDAEDYWRMSPKALRHLFSGYWDVLECDWHLRIPASAGVLDIKNGEPQAVEASYIVARKR